MLKQVDGEKKKVLRTSMDESKASITYPWNQSFNCYVKMDELGFRKCAQTYLDLSITQDLP